MVLFPWMSERWHTEPEQAGFSLSVHMKVFLDILGIALAAMLHSRLWVSKDAFQAASRRFDRRKPQKLACEISTAQRRNRPALVPGIQTSVKNELLYSDLCGLFY